MCMRTVCGECNKPTWKGCGKHIEKALEGKQLSKNINKITNKSKSTKNTLFQMDKLQIPSYIFILFIFRIGVPENDRCKCPRTQLEMKIGHH